MKLPVSTAAVILLAMSGARSAVAQDVTLNSLGPSPGTSYGWDIDAVGDVNGDGFGDLVVGAPNNSQAYLRSGKDGSALFTYSTLGVAEYLGWSLGNAGDIDGDSIADVIIAVPGHVTSSPFGEARVYSGATGNILLRIAGHSQEDWVGAVDGAGDVDGDGIPDLAVSHLGDATGGTSAGAVAIYSGAGGALIHTFYGDSAGDELGQSISGAGDVNLDGYADIIVGIPSDDLKATESGTAKVFSGRDGSLLFQISGDGTFELLGTSVSDAGDTNGDGYLMSSSGLPGT